MSAGQPIDDASDRHVIGDFLSALLCHRDPIRVADLPITMDAKADFATL
jgi:hypothetical protein